MRSLSEAFEKKNANYLFIKFRKNYSNNRAARFCHTGQKLVKKRAIFFLLKKIPDGPRRKNPATKRRNHHAHRYQQSRLR